MGGRGVPRGGPVGCPTIMASPAAGPAWCTINVLTYLEHIMKDILAAVVIGLALTVGALAYFDVLVQ